MKNFTKTFDCREFHFDSSIMSYAGIMHRLVEEYRLKFKAYLLESNSIPLALEYIKDQINALRYNAGTRDFDRTQYANMAKELGVNPSNYLESIINLEEKDTPFSRFIHSIHRDNYLEKYNADIVYDYLDESKVFTGKIKKVENPEQIISEELLNPEHHEQVFDYSFPEYIIKELLDYVHIKTYLSALDKLDNIVDNIIPNPITSHVPNPSPMSQPQSLQKDKTQLEGYQLAFLLYLYVKQFGIDSLKNSQYVFASYFFQLLYGDLGELSKQVANDLSMNESDKKNTFAFLKEINRNTPLSPESSPFLRKWYEKIKGQSLDDIVNLPDRKNKELETSFDAVIRWSQIKRRGGCAFNLAKSEKKGWSFKSKEFNQCLSNLKKTYPKLMTENIIKQSDSFKADCLGFYI